MTTEFVISITTQAVQTLFMVSAPILLSAIVIGVAISIFQTATSISDQTLSFVPKIVVVMMVLIMSLPWMIRKMVDFTVQLYSNLHILVQ